MPWLARTHAVTMVPSSAALRTLRGLPPGKPERSELIAFGDPYFSKEQHDEAMKPVQVADASGDGDGRRNTTRGVPLKRRNSPKLEGVDSAELALLPRLPDTADELKSIALALQADPSKVLQPRQGRQREEGQGDRPVRLQGPGVRHPRPGAGRTQRPDAAGAGAVGARRLRRRGRRAADDGGNPVAQARCRLGGAVGLQHRRGLRRGRRSGLRPRPRVLLRRHARAAGHQLVGAFAVGARTGHRPVQAAGGGRASSRAARRCGRR